MASVDDNSYDITYLTGQDTFLDWVNHYNTSVVEKLNKLEIYSGWSGDGVDVVLGTTGSMQCRLADVVTKGVTFNGDVTINGDLTVDWDSSFMGSVKHKVFPQSGRTGTKGFTTGQPVWIGMSGGDTEYYRARADSKDFAEVVGIVSGLTYSSDGGPYSLSNTYLEIVTHGVVGTSFGSTVTTDSAAGLSAGKIYFLSPGTSGGLTTVEPTTAGHISKPVLLGITADKGLVLNYRGQYLQGSGTGGTGGIDNNQFVPAVDSASTIARGDVVGFKVGDGTNGDGWFKITDYTNIDYMVGVCINSAFTPDGSNYYIRVLSTGWSNDLPTPNASTTGKLWVASDGTLTNVDPGGNSKQIGIGWASGGKVAGIISGLGSSSSESNPLGGGRSFIADGNTYGFAINKNLLINGGFDIWQRDIGVSGVHGTTGSTYFADRWVRREGIGITASVGTHSIQRNTFATNQTAVFGNPKYYASLRNTALSGTTSEYVHIENRIEDVRTLRNEEATLSFWAKCTSSGSTMDIAITQYSGATTSTTYPSNVELGTNWSKYAVTFTVPNITITPTGEHYLGVGFRTEKINAVYDIAKVKLERGNVATTNADINESKELDDCGRYYQRTYSVDELTHSVTMLNINTPNTSVVDFTITPDKDLYHKFPVPMRAEPSVTFFSPSSGFTGDAFNRTAVKDLRNTSGTVGWNGVTRVASAGSKTIIADYKSKIGMYLTVPAGSVIFDNVSMHYVADADLKENM